MVDYKHDLICALKQLTEELGYVPTREQFKEKYGRGYTRYVTLFETWSDFLSAADLNIAKMPARKITNDIFKVDIDQHFEEYSGKPAKESAKYPEILVLGDIHFPFVHEAALNKAHSFAKENQPKYIIQIGDLYDMYSASKFPRSHNIFTPQSEEQKSRDMAEKMWAKFNKDCPQAKLVQLVGNHDVRPMKRAMESLPTMEHWIEKYLKELLTFQNVETIFDSREEYRIQDICFIHGFLSGLGKHRDHFQNKLVCGHSHTGGVVYKQINETIQWEMNCGFLGDQYSKGLSYTPTRTVPWTLGFGFIDRHGPRFIPY